MRSKIGVFHMVACAVFMLAILLALGSLPALAGEPAGIAPSQPQAKELKAEVVYPCTVQLSPPFRSLPISTDKVAVGHEREINNPPLPKASGAQIPDGNQTDPVIQSHPGIDAMPPTLASFAGITNVAGVAPPDTEGDIGPNHYLQWVNLHLAAWQIDRSTNPWTATNVLGPIAGNTIWASLGGPCASNNNGDPIVLWDRFRNRWVISQFALPSPYYTAIAVSQTADPTGSWWLYCFQYDATNLNDYPKFGVWPDGYYMTVNQFAGGSTWAGAGLCVFEADKMITGDASARMLKINLGAVSTDFGGIQPAHFEGMTNPPAGSPCYFLEVDDSTWIPPNDALRLWKGTVNWTAGTFTVGLAGQPDLILDTANWDVLCSGNRNCIPQPGTTTTIDAIGDRLMYRLQYRNYGTYEAMVVNHTVNAGSSRAGIRWYELRKDSGHADWYIYQQGTFAPSDTYNRWMGSAAQDHMGNLAIGYSISDGTSMYPSLYYAGRLASDPLGDLTQGEAPMYLGAASQTGVNRWGDYSSMSIDPTDDCAFWYTQEYSTGGWNWATRVGAFKYGSCSLGATGTLSGTVTNSSALPISGATVFCDNGSITVSTNTAADGTYALTLPVTPPTYSVTASKFGYLPSTVTGVAITDGGTTPLNFSLGAAPSHVIYGTVYDSVTGWPLYAQIAISGAGYPGTTIWTDPVNGYYSITLVDGITYSFAVTAWLSGYNGGSADVTPTGANINQNFAMVANAASCNAPGYYKTTYLAENFDSATPPAVPSGWAVVDVNGTSGDWLTKTSTNYPSGQPPHSAPNLVYFNSWTASSGYSTRLYRTSGINLSAAGAVELSFWLYHDTGYTSSADRIQVQVSTDSGATWQNVGTAVNRYDGSTGWKQHTIPLTGFTGSLADVRVGLLGISAYGNDCHVDDLMVASATCTAPAQGGLIFGNVYDANTGGAAAGAMVSNATTGKSATVVSTSDPNMDDAFYCMYGPDGVNDMTASKTGFGSDTSHPVVPHLGAVLQNFSLTAGHLQTSVSSMSAELPPGQTTTQTLTITNTGGASATYTLKELNATLRASLKTSHGTKASIMNWRKQASKIEKIQAQATNTDLLSAKGLNLPAAPSTEPYAAGDVIASWASGLSMAWGVAYDGNDNTVWVSSPAPSWGGNNTIYEYSPAGAATGRSYPYTWAPANGPGDVAYNWITGNLWVMNIASGTSNCIYEINPATGITGNTICPGGGTGFATSQRGLAYDPITDTFYAGSWNDYMIHHFSSTGAILDEVYVGLSISGLAYNPDTQHLFVMVNASPNLVYVLDAANSYALLGSFSIAGFGDYAGAGLEIDCNGHLWATNQTTQMVYQVDSGEATSVCNTDVPWLSEDPITGTLGPGDHTDIDVTYDSTGLPPATYHAQLKVSNDTPYAVPNVPVTLTVPALSVAAASNFAGGPAPLLVSFTSTVSYGIGPYTYDWNFGDGTPHSNAANPSHRFTASGTYSVTLQIHDSGSAQDATDSHLSIAVTAGLVDRIPYSVVPTKITTTNHGTDATITWDATNCPSANYHIIYGMGSGLPAWTISGGKCALGYSGTYAWSSLPNPSADSKRFLWFLVVGDDGGVSEGSWGKTSADAERGGATASGQCSCTTKVTTTTCGTSPNMPQR